MRAVEKVNGHLMIQDDTIDGLKFLEEQLIEVDYILTSPPYNAFRSDFYMGSDKINDSKSNEEHRAWIVEQFKLYDKVLKKEGVIIYNMNYMSRLENTTSNLYRTMIAIEDNTPFILIDVICWKKRNGTPSREARLSRTWEHVFIFIRKDEWKDFHGNYKDILVGKPNFIEAPNNDFVNDINKACFSSSMVEQLLRLYNANKDSIVLDNFMGTGTTAIGCEKIGCKSIGIELDTKTYKFSKERIREFVGDFEAMEEDYNMFNFDKHE